MEDVMCKSCKRLRNDLDQRLKKIEAIPPEKKRDRVQPSSNFPEKYLSPNSINRKRKGHFRSEHVTKGH